MVLSRVRDLSVKLRMPAGPIKKAPLIMGQHALPETTHVRMISQKLKFQKCFIVPTTFYYVCKRKLWK